MSQELQLKTERLRKYVILRLLIDFACIESHTRRTFNYTLHWWKQRRKELNVKTSHLEEVIWKSDFCQHWEVFKWIHLSAATHDPYDDYWATVLSDKLSKNVVSHFCKLFFQPIRCTCKRALWFLLTIDWRIARQRTFTWRDSVFARVFAH